MVDNCGVPFFSKTKEGFLRQVEPSTLTFEFPNVEEIAKSIWERQRDALGQNAIYYNVNWRDQSIPHKFWDEFVLDAYAVLTLLYTKHIEYKKAKVEFSNLAAPRSINQP